MKNWFVYIVRCSDDTLYCGITTNVERRINEHNSKTGKGAKYTRSRQPVRLVWSLKVENRSNASMLEARIKQLRRDRKEEILCGVKPVI